MRIKSIGIWVTKVSTNVTEFGFTFMATDTVSESPTDFAETVLPKVKKLVEDEYRKSNA